MSHNYKLKLILAIAFGVIMSAVMDRLTYATNPYLLLPLFALVTAAAYLTLSIYERAGVRG